MKKLSLLIFTAFSTGNSDRLRASKIYFLAFLFCCISNSGFAQVIVNPASGGTAICNGASAPTTCNTLGTVTISEQQVGDFAPGTDQVTIIPPAGWVFCVGTCPTFSVVAGSDVTLVHGGGCLATGMTVVLNVTGATTLDAIQIIGLQISPLPGGGANGSITANTETGINGITLGVTDFGDLGLNPGLITGDLVICAGQSTQLSDAVAGGVWTSSNPSVPIDPATGFVAPIGAGSPTMTTNVTYSVTPGCSSTAVLTVNSNPVAITGIHDICPNTCYTISDATVSGISLFTSTNVTVTNIGTPFGGSGTATLCGVNAGLSTVTYTLGTGCFTTSTLNVNPNPQPIIDPTGTYQICAGSTRTLSDGTTGGIWSSSTSSVATITPNSGVISGAGVTSVGTTTITYSIITATTTCFVDTPFRVNPLPGVITGKDSVCVNSTIQLSDATSGGVWSSSNSGIATVSIHGAVTGISAGIATISYTVNSGCYETFSVTVVPVPDPITGPPLVCVMNQITLLETSTGGTWISSNTNLATVDNSNMGIITGVAYGLDTIIYRYSTGCNAIYPLQVDSLPSPIVGPSFVCQNQCITLSDATPGGSWTSLTPGFITAANVGTNPNGMICGVLVSSSIITYMLPTGCFVTYLETVNPLGPIVGPSSVCAGLTISLSDAATPGTWTSSNTNVATIDSVTGLLTGVSSFAGTPPGQTIISFTNTSGCTATTTITVYQSPNPITGIDSICKGLTTTLSDSVSGGAWTSNNGSIAGVSSGGVVTGVNQGTDIITYTLSPGGCFATYTITVNPLPGPVIGPVTVCQGSMVFLSDAFPGGTWTATNTAISTVDSNLGIVTGVSPGVDTIYYTLPTGCLVYQQMTVNPITGISGIDTICAGATTHLSDATAGGTWSSANNAIATVNSTTGLVTGVQPGGTVVITYSMPTGCFATYTVLVNPLPAPITGPSAVCQGQFITLSDATPGGTWSNGNTAVDSINVNTGVVGGVSPGHDIITYTLSATGCSITTSLTVNPLTPILAVLTDVCVGLTINLSDATPGGTWTSGNTTIATVIAAGSTAGTVTGVTAGVDTVYYTITATGCATQLSVTVDPLPAPITGAGPVCVNSTITLSDATPGGTWSSSISTVATIGSGSGIVTGVSSGTDNITYTLTATGCIATTTILVNPLPANIIAPADSSVCIGSSITLSDATPGGTWTSSNSSILSINDTSGVAMGDSVWAVAVRYTLPTTCYITDSIYVRPLPVDTIFIADSGIICKGAKDSLSALGAGNGPFGSINRYVWSPGYALSCTICQNPVATPTITTTYSVLVTTRFGCQSRDSVTVKVDTLLNHLAISGRDSMCVGQCDLLTVVGGQDSIYLWRPSTGLNCTNCDSTLACPTSTTTYYAIAVDFLGCKDSASFTVTVNPLPSLSVSPSPVIVCKRSTTTVTATGAFSGGHYAWFPNLFISCDTCATVTLSDTSNIVYELTGTTQYGCMDSISVPVSVLDTNRNTISDDTIICIGKSAQLAAYSQSTTSNLDIPTFLWIPSTGLNDPYINTPIATPNVTTVYTVIITENACFSDTEHVQVTVEPLPMITITPPSATVIAGSSVQLLATAPNVVVSDFAWAPGNTLSCDTCNNPVATPVAQSTTYTVIAISNFGCISSNTVTINLYCDNSQIFIPNTFTPNGDGVNDRFYISGKGVSVITDFKIYNRWGQLLFEAQNININDAGAGWDGTYKGYVLEPDVFIYEVVGQCELGQVFHYKGDVSIVR